MQIRFLPLPAVVVAHPVPLSVTFAFVPVGTQTARWPLKLANSLKVTCRMVAWFHRQKISFVPQTDGHCKEGGRKRRRRYATNRVHRGRFAQTHTTVRGFAHEAVADVFPSPGNVEDFLENICNSYDFCGTNIS